jgi:anthranilate phosphoribosyltransferase
VVHGAEGLDEISLSGETYVTEVHNGILRSYTLQPEDFGLRRAALAALVGGDAKINAEILSRILDGQAGPPRDIVLANAAAALVAAGRAGNFPEGVRMAADSIDSGAARAKLDQLVAFTNG